jgi:hypothetical protein
MLATIAEYAKLADDSKQQVAPNPCNATAAPTTYKERVADAQQKTTDWASMQWHNA